MDSFVYFRCGQIDLQKSKLHVVMHKIVPISEVLGVNDVLARVCNAHFNNIDELHLRSDRDFLVTPQADLKLYVQVGGQVETIPSYFDFWWVSLVYRVIREVDSFSCCCGGFCNSKFYDKI